MAASWTIVKSDAIDFLKSLPEKSLDLVLCSPSYQDARLYLEDGEDLGIARNADEWVEWMKDIVRLSLKACKGLCVFVVEGKTDDFRYSCTPMLLVADLHREGVCVRKPPIFRRSGIPGSGGPDWLRNDYEFCLCFTSGGRLPWSDNTACGHHPKYAPGGEMSHRTKNGSRVDKWGGTGTGQGARKKNGERAYGTFHHLDDGTTKGAHDRHICAIANPGNVIDEATSEVIHVPVGGGLMGEGDCFATENEAPYPEKLCEVFIRSFCPPGGTVCDPFLGSGTTCAVAVRWGRNFKGCDLRQSQIDLCHKRMLTETPLSLFQ